MKVSACGTSTYKLIKTLVAPAAVTDVTFDEIAALVQTHYQPKPSVIMRRFRFNTCIRHPGENITAFIARLRDLAAHCEYGDNTVELIRDRIVCGIRDDALQRSLLSVPKLTFDKACELTLLHESAEQNSKVLSAPTSVHWTECDASAPAHPKANDRNQAHPETLLPLWRTALCQELPLQRQRMQLLQKERAYSACLQESPSRVAAHICPAEGKPATSNAPPGQSASHAAPPCRGLHSLCCKC